MSLLTLDNDQFSLLWKDFVNRSKDVVKKKEYLKIKAPEKTEFEDQIDIDSIKDEIVADKTIFEMEKAFNDGDKQSVLDMLKRFE